MLEGGAFSGAGEKRVSDEVDGGRRRRRLAVSRDGSGAVQHDDPRVAEGADPVAIFGGVRAAAGEAEDRRGAGVRREVQGGAGAGDHLRSAVRRAGVEERDATPAEPRRAPARTRRHAAAVRFPAPRGAATGRQTAPSRRHQLGRRPRPGRQLPRQAVPGAPVQRLQDRRAGAGRARGADAEMASRGEGGAAAAEFVAAEEHDEGEAEPRVRYDRRPAAGLAWIGARYHAFIAVLIPQRDVEILKSTLVLT